MKLDEFIRRYVEGTLPTTAVAITFDDGYADNLTTAERLLEANEIPATIFLITGFIDRPTEFWWDELARLLLLDWDGSRFEVEIPMKEPLQLKADDIPAPPRKQNLSALLQLWKRLRCLHVDQVEAVMKLVRQACTKHHYVPGTGRALTSSEVLQLSGNGLISLGAHSVTHRALGEIDLADAMQEIIACRDWFESMGVGPISAFAYPYGSENLALRSVVQETGFQYACATELDNASRPFDICAIPRLQVLDTTGEGFEKRLNQHSFR